MHEFQSLFHEIRRHLCFVKADTIPVSDWVGRVHCKISLRVARANCFHSFPCHFCNFGVCGTLHGSIFVSLCFSAKKYNCLEESKISGGRFVLCWSLTIFGVPCFCHDKCWTDHWMVICPLASGLTDRFCSFFLICLHVIHSAWIFFRSVSCSSPGIFCHLSQRRQYPGPWWIPWLTLFLDARGNHQQTTGFVSVR